MSQTRLYVRLALPALLLSAALAFYGHTSRSASEPSEMAASAD